MDMTEWDLFVRAIRTYAPRGFRIQVEQSFDGGAGLAARTQLQYLSQQNQGDYDGRGFKINFRLPAVVAERFRKEGGRKSSDDTVEICGAGAHGDEREHIQVAID